MTITVSLTQTIQYDLDVEADTADAALAEVRARLATRTVDDVFPDNQVTEETFTVVSAGSPAADSAASITDDAADFGRLLDQCDAAAEGDSNDTEIETLQTTVETAVNLLKRLGITIPRAASDDAE